VSSRSSTNPIRLSFGRVLLYSVLITALFASLYVQQMGLQAVMNMDYKILPLQELIASYARNLFWGLTAPLILFFTLRFPIERPRLWRNLGAHLAFYVVFSLVHAFYRTGMYYYFDPSEPLWLTFRVFLSLMINANLWMYLPMVAIGHILLGYRRAREREQQARQLQAELAQAELQVLKSQLHPHFLFNTLNSISALIRIDPKAADRMVVQLSALLRNTLDHIGVQEVPLKEELEVLEDYLQIEQTRFQDRLRVRMHIEPETLDAMVPYLLLQPLAENAVRHGTSKLTGIGEIEVRAWKEGASLVISITDNGLGIAENGAPNGVGLSNTRARLNHLYGAAQHLELQPGERSGAVVVARLPFRTTEDQAPHGEAELTGAVR
jgi:two-component system LytT family sensor kinase